MRRHVVIGPKRPPGGARGNIRTFKIHKVNGFGSSCYYWPQPTKSRYSTFVPLPYCTWPVFWRHRGCRELPAHLRCAPAGGHPRGPTPDRHGSVRRGVYPAHLPLFTARFEVPGRAF